MGKNGVEGTEPGVRFVSSTAKPASNGLGVLFDRSSRDWVGQGNCRDKSPSLFFPSDGVGVEAARGVCADCPVRTPCLEYALATDAEHGVWGGTSERQRRKIAKARRLGVAARQNMG